VTQRTQQRPPTIAEAAALRWQRIAPLAAPWLHSEVGQRMAQRLDIIKKPPAAWANWAAGRGGLDVHRQISLKYPKSKVYLPDVSVNRSYNAMKNIAKKWWNPARLTAPVVSPQAPTEAQVNMVWANMLLHTSANPQDVIAQWYRALAVDGFVMFSCLGPDTCIELRRLYESLAFPPPSHTYTDMHDWGDMLVQAGFAEPVMDMERIRLTFASPARLIEELRGLGRNLHPQRHAGLRTPAWRKALELEMTKHMQGQDGQLGLTFEVIYGHAFKPAPRIKLSEHSAVSLSDMRAMLAQAKKG
jgi:malonyl-CoA O-methyltransferase